MTFEYASGRYILTPFVIKYKLCDFFDDPLVGHLVLKALAANVRCPFLTVSRSIIRAYNIYYSGPLFTIADANFQK